MRIVLVLGLACLLAGSAMAANVSRDGYQEAVPQGYEDQLRTGGYLVINILEDTFSDLCGEWDAAFGGASCVYDPLGSWGTDYDAVVLLTVENWWSSYNFGPDLATAGSYLDAGGCFWIVGQDFLYGAGTAGVDFVTNRMCMSSVIQDVLWNPPDLMSWQGQGSLAGLSGEMFPCFYATDNLWYTDDVVSSYPVADWQCAGYSGQAGSECNRAFFSSVDFGCDFNNLPYVVGALLDNLCEGGTPVEESTWGAVKHTWR